MGRGKKSACFAHYNKILAPFGGHGERILNSHSEEELISTVVAVENLRKIFLNAACLFLNAVVRARDTVLQELRPHSSHLGWIKHLKMHGLVQAIDKEELAI